MPLLMPLTYEEQLVSVRNVLTLAMLLNRSFCATPWSLPHGKFAALESVVDLKHLLRFVRGGAEKVAPMPVHYWQVRLAVMRRKTP